MTPLVLEHNLWKKLKVTDIPQMLKSSKRVGFYTSRCYFWGRPGNVVLTQPIARAEKRKHKGLEDPRGGRKWLKRSRESCDGSQRNGYFSLAKTTKH
jgi:hypothetical protein